MTDPLPASPVLTATVLLQLYHSGQRNFETVILVGANLAGADLKGADFSYADFSGANLRGANLRGADLSYANLAEADLRDADLRGAMLIGTDLKTATVTATQWTAADYDPETTHFPPGFDASAAGMKADR
ncbi:MAG: pentapeptide repeat-containing protein [Cyanobacteriota bacterium]|nr:pentapeptide repeat-containing protein [Cyanobacteriota bacterium]